MNKSKNYLVSKSLFLAYLFTPVLESLAQESALISAIRNNEQSLVFSLLSSGADPNTRQGDGSTALHWAAHRNSEEVVQSLLDAGANVDASNELGATPLWLAASNGSEVLVEKLLSAGANPNVRLKMG